MPEIPVQVETAGTGGTESLSPILLKILAGRGVTGEALEAFLNPSLAGLANPEDLPGIVEAADVVLDSVLYRRKIVIFGDYDCDGVCATAILSRALRALGGNVAEFVPERLTEGYGMSDASVARMLKDNPGVGLVITVDNGINSISQIDYLKSRWLSVVVTDHHLPGDELPKANALVDPKVAAPPHLQELCGAGVAFLLANRIISEAKRRGMYSGPSVGGPLLVLAGIATVTDVMPLLGQNRILVAEALRRFAQCAPIGLRELHARAARSASVALTSKDFGFLLGPRINAAGRISSAMEALELILSDDLDISRELARIIDGYNLERKAIEQRMTDMALSLVVEGAAAQVINLPEGNPGIAGIVAARVMEKLGSRTPVCVIAGGHGSARAPDGLNIRDAFVACADLLETFGGHAAAGGFSVKEGCVDEFRQRLCAYCKETLGDALAPVGDEGIAVDAWLDLSDVTMKLTEDIARLAPFGEGNPEPVFGLRGVYLSDVRTMGADGRHLSLSVAATTGRIPAANRLKAVWWAHGDQIELLRAHGVGTCDIAFTLAVSEYGERHVELRLIELRWNAASEDNV